MSRGQALRLPLKASPEAARRLSVKAGRRPSRVTRSGLDTEGCGRMLARPRPPRLQLQPAVVGPVTFTVTFANRLIHPAGLPLPPPPLRGLIVLVAQP